MRRILFGFSLLVLPFLLSLEAKAQDTIVKKKKQSISKISRSAEELKNSLDINDEEKIAKNYEELAQGFIDKGDHPKAEIYLKKALVSYTKLKKTYDQSRVTRNLAKVQELQNKIKEASSNYELAGKIAKDDYYDKINANDASRLKDANVTEQNNYLNSNLELLKEQEKKEEVVDAYVQKASNSFKFNDKVDAIESYKQAIVYAESKPKKVIQLQTEIAKIYASDNQFDLAIAINKEILNKAIKQKDFDTQIKQMQSLSEVYFKKNEPEKAIVSLKKAYQLAALKGNTIEVKKSLTAILSYYKKHEKDKESIALYDDFFRNFDKIIASDTTLIDAKTFQITEDKIQQLEKEKGLKDELISRKNTFNYFLIVAVFMLLVFFGFIVKALYSIKRKNKEIALQSLRREMNPHFIFNSLNSVNQFISQNKELEANKYLSSYSTLMRNMMENSNKDFVTIATEINQLKKYLDLEHLRFQDKFDYEITIDETIDTDGTYIPNMIIQPHLENAIWHGLRYLDTKGLLQLKIQLKEGKIRVSIDDNGIGLTKSQELKTSNQKVHESRGLTNTAERIALLTELYKHSISFKIEEKSAPQTGTIVIIDFPIIHKV